MLLGNLNRSNLLVIIFLFFGSVSVGFSVIGETQYAIISIVIAAIIHFFNQVPLFDTKLDDQQASFGLELDVLSKMVVYGLAPAVLLVKVTNGAVGSVVVAALFLLAAAIRLAHYNRPVEYQGDDEEGKYYGLPLVAITIVLPLLSLISWIIPGYIAVFLWTIIYLVVLVGYVIKMELPSIPSNYKYALLALGALSVIALILQGPLNLV